MIDNIKSTFYNIKDITNIMINLILTLPSIIYHGIYNLIYKDNNLKGNIVFNRANNSNLILLVHGHNGHPYNFLPFIDYFKKHDKYIDYTIIAINLKKAENISIEEEAKYIDTFINKYNYDTIIIIGLSKGGLVASKVSCMNTKIKKLITLSSPLHGTKTCIFLPKFNENNKITIENLKYNNEIALNIKSELEKIDKIEIFHVVPKYDHMIYPCNSSKYDFTKETNIYYYNKTFYSHVGILYNMDINQQIIKWIIQ